MRGFNPIRALLAERFLAGGRSIRRIFRSLISDASGSIVLEDLVFEADSAVEPELNAFTSPLDFPSCVAYFDMLESSSFTNTGGFITSITNLASAVAWTEGTVPPAYNATGLNGLPTMVGNGTTQRIISTEAAVYGAFAGSTAYTMYFVCDNAVADANGEVFGVGNSGVANNRTRNWGQSSTGAGRWVSSTINDAGTANSAESSSSTPSDTSPHVHCWISYGTQVSHFLDDAETPDPAYATQNPGTLTPNRSSLFSRPDSVPDFWYNGAAGFWAIHAATQEPWRRRIETLWILGRWGL